jgi:hypothetical protein
MPHIPEICVPFVLDLCYLCILSAHVQCMNWYWICCKLAAVGSHCESNEERSA